MTLTFRLTNTAQLVLSVHTAVRILLLHTILLYRVQYIVVVVLQRWRALTHTHSPRNTAAVVAAGRE